MSARPTPQDYAMVVLDCEAPEREYQPYFMGADGRGWLDGWESKRRAPDDATLVGYFSRDKGTNVPIDWEPVD